MQNVYVEKLEAVGVEPVDHLEETGREAVGRGPVGRQERAAGDQRSDRPVLFAGHPERTAERQAVRGLSAIEE